jgi:hypothetical protein
MQLGELATGGRLSHGHFVSGYITSLPGVSTDYNLCIQWILIVLLDHAKVLWNHTVW